jgi:uncharacterized membrane protein
VTWAAILATAAGCYLLKLAGLSVPQRMLADPRVRRVAALLPVALLAGLAAVQTFPDGPQLDARVAGVGAGGMALALRAPFLVVVGVAAAVAALLRLAT